MLYSSLRLLQAASFLNFVSALWPEPVFSHLGHEVLLFDENASYLFYTCNYDDLLLVDQFSHSLHHYQARSLEWLVQKYGRRVEYLSNMLKATSIIQCTARNGSIQNATPVKQISFYMHPEEMFRFLVPDRARLHLEESYVLEVQEDGTIAIHGMSIAGWFRGETTLQQLMVQSGGQTYIEHVPAYVADGPRFTHRGLNLDVSRSFYPVSDLLRTIDALAINKMNRLHLHMTDSQAWPLEVPSLPDLAAKGAYGKDSIYSADDLAHIQEYGDMKYVTVYIEIDMPGHTSSIFHAYPELIAAYNVQPNWVDFAAEPPSGTMKLNSSDVYDFLDALWDDVLPRVSQYNSFMHTGGDEINLHAYTLDETVNSEDPGVVRPLLQYFVDKAHGRIREAGLTPIVWEEMLLKYNLTLGNDVLVQTWLGTSSTRKTVEAGHKTIASNADYWYLDCGHGAWLDSDSVQNKDYPDWCSPRKNWRRMYDFNPLEDVPPHMQHLVIGGEVSLWSEQTDPVNLDVMLWPRTSAAAEILWSGPKAEDGGARNQSDITYRLAEMRNRLVAMGVRAEPVRMLWCERNGGCDAL